MEVKREDLIKAAKELNNVLGLDPQIKTGKKVTEEELSEQILEAAELILPEDDISEETMRVIKLLKDESESEEDEELEEVEEDEELEEVEEDEELDEVEEDTEVEEVEEDEDFETEEEEVEDEVDESETKKAKKVEKDQKVKKDMKSNKQKKENVSENDRSKSNKAIVYEAWKSNITDIKELAARVDNKVKESTIRIWISHWKKGKNLPAIARKKDDK